MFKLSFELSALCAGEDLHRERIQHHVRSGDRDWQLERSRRQACAHRRRAPERRALGAADAGCLLQDLDAARSRRGPTSRPRRRSATRSRRRSTRPQRPIAEEACHIRRHRLQPRRGPAAVTMKPARDGLGEPPTSSRGNSTSASTYSDRACGPGLEQFLDRAARPNRSRRGGRGPQHAPTRHNHRR
jgi:hypothetical protein